MNFRARHNLSNHSERRSHFPSHVTSSQNRMEERWRKSENDWTMKARIRKADIPGSRRSVQKLCSDLLQALNRTFSIAGRGWRENINQRTRRARIRKADIPGSRQSMQKLCSDLLQALKRKSLIAGRENGNKRTRRARNRKANIPGSRESMQKR